MAEQQPATEPETSPADPGRSVTHDPSEPTVLDLSEPAVPGTAPVPASGPEPAPADRPQEPGAAEPPVPAEQPVPADPAGLAGPAAPTDPQPAVDAASRPRKPRTAGLLLAALLIGPVLGAGVGYAVQAGRPPTPLPPLGAGTLAYPQTRLDAKAAAAAGPKALPIDGDLRKLLIDRPAGTEELNDDRVGHASGWLSVGDKALTYGNSASEFRKLLGDGFRRDAYLGYYRGDVEYRVELMQFGPDDSSASTWMLVAGLQGGSIDGTTAGYYSVPKEPETYADSTEKFYYGLATARRGDVVMRITIHSPAPVDADELRDLAKRQWERLK